MSEEKYVDINEIALRVSKEMHESLSELSSNQSLLLRDYISSPFVAMNEQMLESQGRLQEALSAMHSRLPELVPHKELQEALSAMHSRLSVQMDMSLPPFFFKGIEARLKNYDDFKRKSLQNYESKKNSLEAYLKKQGYILPESDLEFLSFWIDYSEEFLGLNFHNCSSYSIQDYDFIIYYHWRLCRLENLSPWDSYLHVWGNIDKRNLDKSILIDEYNKDGDRIEPKNFLKKTDDLAIYCFFKGLIQVGSEIDLDLSNKSKLVYTESIKSFKDKFDVDFILNSVAKNSLEISGELDSLQKRSGDMPNLKLKLSNKLERVKKQLLQDFPEKSENIVLEMAKYCY